MLFDQTGDDTPVRVHGFGIMSSDSDFMPLAMRIRQDGLPVYGFGTSKTPWTFEKLFLFLYLTWNDFWT